MVSGLLDVPPGRLASASCTAAATSCLAGPPGGGEGLPRGFAAMAGGIGANPCAIGPRAAAKAEEEMQAGLAQGVGFARSRHQQRSPTPHPQAPRINAGARASLPFVDERTPWVWGRGIQLMPSTTRTPHPAPAPPLLLTLNKARSASLCSTPAPSMRVRSSIISRMGTSTPMSRRTRRRLAMVVLTGCLMVTSLVSSVSVQWVWFQFASASGAFLVGSAPPLNSPSQRVDYINIGGPECSLVTPVMCTVPLWNSGDNGTLLTIPYWILLAIFSGLLARSWKRDKRDSAAPVS
jgi:hypothetical protein